MGTVIVPVRDRASRDRFIRFPWQIYADDPAWVPPLIADVRKLMGEDHPFHEHADTEFFLAIRDGDVVGRIAAAVNHLYNDFHDTRTGFIGLFESVDDQAVADLLLETAADWLRDRDQAEAIGPFNLSTNDELYSPGVLLDTYDEPPVLLMAHTPPYYRGLFENAGWEKVKDLLSYRLRTTAPPDRLVRGVKRMTRRIEGLEVRQIELKQLDEEVERIKEVYNAAWERNWGFAPLTDAEIRHLAKDLKPIVDERFAMIAEIHGEPVGFALALPDYNQALKHVNGRLFPFGIFKLLWYKRKISRVRIFTLGLKPEYRRTGIDALFYIRMFEEAVKTGLEGGEAGWILEDNWGMRRGMEKMGAYVFKTYRVYGQELG
ncbi:MAG: N-acetyltransferase family protein [Candidatus Longimicrobiales bacterium M2_2A_002]